MKYGSFTGLSSSNLKLEEQISDNNSISDIFYQYEIINYFNENIYNNSLEVERSMPTLPSSMMDEIIPSGYFLISQQGDIGSKYPFYFSYMSFFFKETLNLEVFYIIPFFSILFLMVFILLSNLFFSKKNAYIALIILFSFPVLTSLFMGRFVREILSIFLAYLTFYFFYKYYKEKDWIFIFFGSFFLGLSVSLRITNILILIPIIILLYEELIDKLFYIKNYKKILVSKIYFLLGLIPFLFQFIYPKIMYEKIFLPISGNIGGFSVTHFFTNSRQFFLPNWYVSLDYILGTFGIISLLIITIYFYKYFDKDKNKLIYTSLFSFFLISWLFFSFWVNPWPRYFINAIPVLAILLLYSSKVVFKRKYLYLFIVSIFIIFSLNSLYNTYNKQTFYFSEVYDKNDYYNIIKTNNYIENNSLILFHSSKNSVFTRNQNIRGYMDSVLNADVIGVNNLKDLDKFCIKDLEDLNYEKIYFISEDIEIKNFYENKIIYSFNITHNIFNGNYNLYDREDIFCNK